MSFPSSTAGAAADASRAPEPKAEQAGEADNAEHPVEPVPARHTAGAAAVQAAADQAVEAPWPNADGRIVFLLDACTSLERSMLERWVDKHRPPSTPASCVEIVSIPPSRRRAARQNAKGLVSLETAIAAGGDPVMAPLRVAWFSANPDGLRHLSTLDILTMTDPRDPGPLRQRWTARRHPARARVVAGEPARLSELRATWRERGGQDETETTGLAEFVAQYLKIRPLRAKPDAAADLTAQFP